MHKGIRYTVGIDEVGRGPLAGPVTVCACVASLAFDMKNLEGIKDSKKLSRQKREAWFQRLWEMKDKKMIDFAHASVTASEIDAVGISKAIEKAIHVALAALTLAPKETYIYLDGSLRAPKAFPMQETIIKGDEKVPIISAASIIAKVVRDRFMDEQAEVFPEYGFDEHKGYGTSAHMHAIRAHGASPLHRRSFLTRIIAKTA